MPDSRWGTWSSSTSSPTPPRAPISQVEQVSPAAPISWMPTTAPVRIASMQASSSSFSMKGSPTCTLGRFCSAPSLNSSLAMVAPWIPSRPVFAPT